MNKRTFSLSYLASAALAVAIALSFQTITVRQDTQANPLQPGATVSSSFLTSYYTSLKQLLNEYQGFGPFS